MRFDLMEGERLSGIDVEIKDGVLICPILICLRRVEAMEDLGNYRVQVPPEYVDNKLATALVDVRLKILERLNHGQISEG